ncbi:membrane protein [Amorphoplanes auranticolor]|uniref:Membrane protein n=1 Tax=Actinoplanes auranticolor TaxID=47988 RepID=A0A919ST77_9ACTN|nr:membrane protein [Actinoplanes auranticolor]
MLRRGQVQTAAGCAGAVLVTVGALLGRPGLVHVYAGLALLVLAWWRYDRHGSARPWVTLALWAGPLLAAPPLFSRDVYSYLAQGLMIADGLDVYRHGPAALGGPIAERVPAVWQDTPSPYGPVSMLVSRAVTAVTGEHAAAGVLAMRLVALGALVLIGLVVPLLAPGHAPAVFRLVVLNPLVLIHLVGGAHNDALMVGLLAVGLAAAVRDRPVVAAALVTAATLVKAPAALGLVAVAVLWAARSPGRRPGVRASLGTGAVAAACTVVVTAVAGTGYGWIGALDTPISSDNWSPTALLGRWTAAVFAHDDVGAALSVQLWRWAGVLATLIVAGLVWTYRNRIGVLPGLGLVLLAVVAFGPALRPWYVVWGLLPLAAGWPGSHRRLAVLCTVLTPVVLPDGYAADLTEVLAAVLGVLLGAAVSGLVRLPVPARAVPR